MVKSSRTFVCSSTRQQAVGSHAATEALIDTSECVGPRNGRKMTAAFIITTWPAVVYYKYLNIYRNFLTSLVHFSVDKVDTAHWTRPSNSKEMGRTNLCKFFKVPAVGWGNVPIPTQFDILCVRCRTFIGFHNLTDLLDRTWRAARHSWSQYSNNQQRAVQPGPGPVRSRAANEPSAKFSQSQRRPLQKPSPGWKRLQSLSHLRHY